MVDTDNARSKREFKKLSKVMGDKLDKEKGRYVLPAASKSYLVWRRPLTHVSSLLFCFSSRSAAGASKSSPHPASNGINPPT
jgi:hypothetical protein